MQLILLTLVFLAVFGLVLGLGLWLSRNEALERRLEQLDAGPDALDAQGQAASAEWQAKVAKVAAPIAWLSTPNEGWDASNLRVTFMQAGLRGPGWPVIFFTAKTLLTFLLPGMYLLYRWLTSASASAPQITVLTLLFLAGVGYYLPNGILRMSISRRKRELEEAMPDAVDLMTVCVEAGLGLDAAMNRAAQEMGLRSVALADELNLVALELRVGSTRENALRNFALRTGVGDVLTFVTIVLQAGHFGTSVADSLRVLSDTMRERRKTRAEERAAKIPLKLLFPLVFFIFPSLFVVLIGPAVLGIARVLLPAIKGG